ncbi:MAG TPA: hypothetical protein VNT55_12210, partial [Baekduia sp.]|nr:hypothetical protein [Baekduia sp.]
GQGGFGLKATITLGGGDDTFDDRLARTDWPVDDLDAGDGNDIIYGGYGADTLRGGAGNDQLRGIAADDQIDGGPGDDTIHGGGGNDTIAGGAGRDTILGDGDYSNQGLDSGNDTIQARDGEVDSIACGFGADTAVLDAADVTDSDIACESLDRPAAPAPVAPPAAPAAPVPVAPTPPAALTVALGTPKAVTLGALARGKALSLAITPSANCVATIRLKVKTTVIAQALKAAPARRVSVALVVKKSYRARLRRASSLKATLAVSCADASGAKATASLPLTLKR